MTRVARKWQIYLYLSQENNVSRLMLRLLLAASATMLEDLALDSDLEPEAAAWLRETILERRLGTGTSLIDPILESSAGVRELTTSCRARSTASSSSTFTLVTSFVSRKLLGKVEYIEKGSAVWMSISLCLNIGKITKHIRMRRFNFHIRKLTLQKGLK